jgi:hypothetical protein
MLRRLALPVALATLLLVSACGTAAPAGDPLSTTATDASGGASEQGTAEQSSTAGASESAATGPDAFSSAAAALNTGEPGLPHHSGASIDDVLRSGAVATWTAPPHEFAISLPASSDCWASAGEPRAVDGDVVVGFVQEPECDAADGARTYTMTVPEGVDTSDTVEVSVEGLDLRFTLALPGQ